MKKKLCILFATLCFTLSLPFGTDVYASDNPADSTTSSAPEITPRKVGYGWKYKIVDGVLYKRLYNYTFSVWVGDWIKA